MAKVSIIVPVYNAENQIEKCLDALINQTTKKELEILVINDGSNDNSATIIQDYMRKTKKCKY